jgi:DNA primase
VRGPLRQLPLHQDVAPLISIEELREEIPITEVLAHYGAIVGSRGSWSRWVPVNCPFCRDSNGSGSVNRVEGVYLCFQCGEPDDGRAGDIVDIVKSQENLDTKDAMQWLYQTFIA